MNDVRWMIEVLGGEGGSIELPATGTLVIGSLKERAGFVLQGQGVDEAHCAIGRTKEGDWAVKDLGSRYGTTLNGQRVAAARLKIGDQLVLGSRRLEVRPFKPEGTRAASPGGAARPADMPAKIAGYRIERLIGKGGMGAVYLAVQESLRRPVALKVLAPKLAADHDFVQRFQAEARAAAALSHPNVVVVYDVGEEHGAHYLSMEFMAGGSLEQKLAASGPLPWKSLLTVLQDAAGGLAYAESRGIVHRDIKPANLMFSGTGTVKIADLGLATTLEQEAIEADAVPGGARKVFGTPHFISPEQARGEAVDHRSDLYSLGATAYRLLSGRTPFEGGSTREILRALQSESPRPLAELVRTIPPELEALVARLMEKDPRARFPTAEALRRECERLRLVAEHGPTLEAERGARSQWKVGVALLTVLGLASAAWFVLGKSPPPENTAARTDSSPTGDAPPEDPSFFSGDAKNAGPAADEEQALRAREHAASAALREIAPFLGAEERIAALRRVATAFSGTEAAHAAQDEIAALERRPAEGAADLAALEKELEEQLAALAQGHAKVAERLAAIDGFAVPSAVRAEFDARRSTLAETCLRSVAEEVRARFEQGTQLALNGEFTGLRALYAELASFLEGLDGIGGPGERLAPLRELATDLARRAARVDEEERVYHQNLERQKLRSLGEAFGPGSGLMAELASLDFAAVEKRLNALAPELRARAAGRTLEHELGLARQALETLRQEFAGGTWRRKQLVDPRTRRPREVRDVRAEGLIFDRDGALETVPWRETKGDPEWWSQLFKERLTRGWASAEERAIGALLRLVGATRAAELAREMLDARARGTLQPAEIQAIGTVFDPALPWLAGAPAEERAALESDQGLARALARALDAAQNRAWTGATADLERLLRDESGSLLVALLSDGTDWRTESGAAPR